ncbi:MAG: glycosyltransferase [Bacteroidetes bacterium]|nr:glycosyltransferase [Bacteroidota bacterium]
MSVALTTYNHGDYIKECLDSILDQDFESEFEIVVSDDCSSDQTGIIIESYCTKYPDKFNYIKREKNIGYVKNLDDVIKNCRGEYIAIFDGDDIMKKEKLKKQVEYLDDMKNVVMVGHDARAFNSGNNKTIEYIRPKQKLQFFNVEDLFRHGSFFANSSKMFRRSAFPEKGIDHNLKLIADWYLSIEIALKGDIGYIYEVLMDYRVHGSSIMRNIDGRTHFEDMSLIINGIENRFPGKYTHSFKSQWAYACLVTGISEFKRNNIKVAKDFLKQSINYDPYYRLSQYFYLLFSYAPRFVRKIITR